MIIIERQPSGWNISTPRVDLPFEERDWRLGFNITRLIKL